MLLKGITIRLELQKTRSRRWQEPAYKSFSILKNNFQKMHYNADGTWYFLTESGYPNENLVFSVNRL